MLDISSTNCSRTELCCEQQLSMLCFLVTILKNNFLKVYHKFVEFCQNPFYVLQMTDNRVSNFLMAHKHLQAIQCHDHRRKLRHKSGGAHGER